MKMKYKRKKSFLSVKKKIGGHYQLFKSSGLSGVKVGAKFTSSCISDMAAFPQFAMQNIAQQPVSCSPVGENTLDKRGKKNRR